MVTTAPEITQAGWLDPFLADWRPGTGDPRETREPASGRPLLTLPQSTTEDVARAAAAAAEAQPDRTAAEADPSEILADFRGVAPAVQSFAAGRRR